MELVGVIESNDLVISVQIVGAGPQGIPGPTGPQGATGPQGETGEDGYTPVKGVDYFTTEDIEEIAAEAADLVDVPVTDVTFNNQSVVSGKVARIPSALSSYSEDANHRLVRDNEKANWNNAVQPSAITDMATKTWVNSQGFADSSDIPTAVSELQNDAGYLTLATLPVWDGGYTDVN